MRGKEKERIAVLGLGIVGSRVRERLVGAGYEVTSWSRTARGLEGEKGSAREAVEGADVISVYLKDAPMVREVFADVKGAMMAGAVVMNHATIDLETTLWLAEQCAGRGCDFLDAPFTGSKEAAGAGKLLYYIGGDEELIEKMGGILETSSKGRIHCGEIGTATVTKLGTNLISACTVEAMGEALAIAVRHGVRAEVFAEAATRNGSGSALMAMKYPGMIAGEYEAHFTLANMLKDSRYAIDLAAAAGLEVPAIAAVSARMAEMCGRGYGEMDFSAVGKAYEGGE